MRFGKRIEKSFQQADISGTKIEKLRTLKSKAFRSKIAKYQFINQQQASTKNESKRRHSDVLSHQNNLAIDWEKVSTCAFRRDRAQTG